MSRTKVMTVDSLNGQTRDLDEDDFEVTEFDTPEDRSKTEDDEKASSPEILPSSSQVGFGGTLKVCLHASVERASGNIEGGSDKALGKPPMDWLEPLEEDDDDDDDDDDDAHMEMESLAGESERSGSVAGSERSYRRRGGRMGITGSRRRRKYMMDEGWEVWPILGAGWKRKEVFRRSGHSVGQSDTYYMSPDGERVRSRIELIRTVAGAIDLAKFDFKTGKFLDVEAPLRRPKRKRVETSLPVDNGLSESSFPDDQMDTGDRAYSPDMPHSICPSASQRLTSSHRSPFKRSATASSGMDSHLPGLHSQAPGPEGRSGSPQDADGMRSNARHAESAVLRPAFRESALQAYEEAGDTDCMQPQPRFCICKRCKQSLTGADGQMICKNCSIAEAYKDNRNISFRKWLPCGQCRACQITEDCGACASCRNGLLNPESQKPVRCRKRKCLCPIRKTKTEEFAPAAQISFEPEYEDSMSSIPQYSDSEEFSVFFNDDDDDDEDDEGGPKKRLRRSCGNCEACQCRKDCGTCDFCIDKPKFGGSNKKRQKCRLRQCQREAMLGQSEILTQGGWVAAGRPRHQHPNVRKGCKGKGRLDLDFSDSEANLDVRQRGSSDSPWMQEKDRLLNLRYNGPVNGGRAQIKENGLLSRSPTTNRLRSLEPKIWHKESGSLAGAQCASSQLGHADESLSGDESINHSAEDGMHTAEQDEEDSTPMITQIFSLADDSAVVSGVDLDHGLLQLMEALRRAVLPILWFTIMVEGPRLQLLQCSKLSTMADTVLQIDPSFSYCISVQGQPLLPTHRLFEHHPRHLTSVVQVVALLQDLEKYAICLGFVHRETALGPEPVVLERAATCEFLVPQRAERCASCMRS